MRASLPQFRRNISKYMTNEMNFLKLHKKSANPDRFVYLSDGMHSIRKNEPFLLYKKWAIPGKMTHSLVRKPSIFNDPYR
jgi:hypothetical protein